MKDLRLGAGVALGSLLLAACATTPQAPAPWGPDVLGLTASGKLIGFNHGQPGEVQRSVAISGLASGEKIVAIDFRPADGALFGLGSAGDLYLIDAATGVATQKSRLDVVGGVQGTRVDIDFDPASSALRVTSDAGENLSVDVDSGKATAGTAWGPGKPALIGAGYTSGGRLYVMSSGADELAVVMQPASGLTVTVGAIGSDVDTGSGGFDVAGDESGGVAYAAMSAADATASKLYMVKLGSGSAKSQGTIGGGEKIQSIALVPGFKL